MQHDQNYPAQKLSRLHTSLMPQKALPYLKRKQKPLQTVKDTPATRKQRLQQRLQEISDKSEQEIAALIKSVDKVKATFKPKTKKSR
jgi:hypothetical protein